MTATQTAGIVDPQTAKALLELHLKTIETVTGDDENEHYAVGKAWAQIIDHKLAELGGYRTSHELFEARIRTVPRSSLSMYAAVARAFTEPVAVRYGVTRLNLLLTLRNTLDVGELLEDPGDFEVSVPDRTGAISRRPFRDCSTTDLRRAIRALKAPAQPLPPEHQAAVDAIQGALDRILGEDSPAAVKLRVRGKATLVQLDGIPLELLDEVGAELARLEPR